MRGKESIVADGENRIRPDPRIEARLERLRESIRGRHAQERERAGFFGRLIPEWKMRREFHRESAKQLPSRQALYSERALLNPGTRMQ